MSQIVCVCARAHASNAKLYKLGQSVKTHNHMMFQNQRNMIIPTTFVFHGIQKKKKKKNLRDILNYMYYFCNVVNSHMLYFDCTKSFFFKTQCQMLIFFFSKTLTLELKLK